MVKLEGFGCGYGERRILAGIDALFPSASATALVGPSGIGKSPLLKAINRLHEVEGGGCFVEGSVRARIGGEERDLYRMDPRRLRRMAGYIFQAPTPLPMSIYRNVSFALEIAGERDGGRVEEALRRVALWEEVRDRLDEDARRLSLGQQQRLAIARALVTRPEILLFDEPTSSLDPGATARIEALIRELAAEKTILLVTHDMGQAERVCDRILSLEPYAVRVQK
jgi:phosphate transport system ATP-binding protein